MPRTRRQAAQAHVREEPNSPNGQNTNPDASVEPPGQETDSGRGTRRKQNLTQPLEGSAIGTAIARIFKEAEGNVGKKTTMKHHAYGLKIDHIAAINRGEEDEFTDTFCTAILMIMGTPKKVPEIEYLSYFIGQYLRELYHNRRAPPVIGEGDENQAIGGRENSGEGAQATVSGEPDSTENEDELTKEELKQRFDTFCRRVLDFVSEGLESRNRNFRKRFMKLFREIFSAHELVELFQEQRQELLPVLLSRCKDVDVTIRAIAMDSIRKGYLLEELDEDIAAIFEKISVYDPSAVCRARALRMLHIVSRELPADKRPAPVNVTTTKGELRQEVEQAKLARQSQQQGNQQQGSQLPPQDILEGIDADDSLLEENPDYDDDDEEVLKPVIRGVPTLMEDEFDFLQHVIRCSSDRGNSVRSAAYSILKNANVSLHTLNRIGKLRAEKDAQVPDFLANRILRGVVDRRATTRNAAIELTKSWLPPFDKRTKAQRDQEKAEQEEAAKVAEREREEQEKAAQESTQDSESEAPEQVEEAALVVQQDEPPRERAPKYVDPYAGKKSGLLLLLKEFDVMLGTDTVLRKTDLPHAKEDAINTLFDDPSIVKEDVVPWIKPQSKIDFEESVSAQGITGGYLELSEEQSRELSEKCMEETKELVARMTPEKACYLRLISKRVHVYSQTDVPDNVSLADAADIDDLINFTIAFFDGKIRREEEDEDDLSLDDAKSKYNFIYGQLLLAIFYCHTNDAANTDKLKYHVETALCSPWDVGSNCDLLMKVLKKVMPIEDEFLDRARDLFNSISPNIPFDQRWDAQLTMLHAILSNVNNINIFQHESLYTDFSGPIFLCINEEGIASIPDDTAADAMQILGLLALAFPAKAHSLVQIMVQRYSDHLRDVEAKEADMQEEIRDLREECATVTGRRAQKLKAQISQLETARAIPETWDERRHILQIVCDVMLKHNFIHTGCVRIITAGLQRDDDPELQSICVDAAARLVFANIWEPHEEDVFSKFIAMYYNQYDFDRSPRSHDSFCVAHAPVEILEFFFSYYSMLPENSKAMANIYPSVIFDSIKEDFENVTQVQAQWRAYDDSRAGEMEEPNQQLNLNEVNDYFSRLNGVFSNLLEWTEQCRNHPSCDFNPHGAICIALVDELSKMWGKVDSETREFQAFKRATGVETNGRDVAFYRVYEHYTSWLFEFLKQVKLDDQCSLTELKSIIDTLTELFQNQSYDRASRLVMQKVIASADKYKEILQARGEQLVIQIDEGNDTSMLAIEGAEVEGEEADATNPLTNDNADDLADDPGTPQILNHISSDPGDNSDGEVRIKLDSPQGNAPQQRILADISSDLSTDLGENISSLNEMDLGSIIAGIQSTPRTTPRTSLAPGASILDFDETATPTADPDTTPVAFNTGGFSTPTPVSKTATPGLTSTPAPKAPNLKEEEELPSRKKGGPPKETIFVDLLDSEEEDLEPAPPAKKKHSSKKDVKEEEGVVKKSKKSKDKSDKKSKSKDKEKDKSRSKDKSSKDKKKRKHEGDGKDEKKKKKSKSSS